MQVIIAILLFMIVLGLLPIIIPVVGIWAWLSPESLIMIVLIVVGVALTKQSQEPSSKKNDDTGLDER